MQVLKVNVTPNELFQFKFKILASLAWQLEVHTAEFEGKTSGPSSPRGPGLAEGSAAWSAVFPADYLGRCLLSGSGL